MKILIVGHVCIDRNVTESGRFTGAGSPAMFMHKIFSQLPETSVQIIATYGKDFLPFKGTAQLYPTESGNIDTLVYENTMTGNGRIQKCFHHEVALPPRITGELQELVHSADCICFAPLTPAFSVEYVKSLVSFKQQHATVFLLPQGYFRQFDPAGLVTVREFTEANTLLPYINAVIVSDQDHSDMYTLAHEWAKTSGTTVIMTRAEKGATIITPDREEVVPTTPVDKNEIVSSIGAGDIFSAGFMYEFQRSGDALKAAQIGNSLARQGLFFTPDTLQITLR